MPSMKSKLRIAAAFAALATLALAVSCRGFFVKPTLTALSVGPAGLTLNVNQTFQMVATGTYNDGNQSAVTKGLVWSSDTPSAVSVGQSSGMVTGVAQGSANITASSSGCSACTASTQVKVVCSGVTQISVSPSSQSVTRGGNAVSFTASATPCGDITQTGTWNIFDASNTNQDASFTIQYVSASGQESFLPATTATAGTYTVVVTYPNTTVKGNATLTVN